MFNKKMQLHLRNVNMEYFPSTDFCHLFNPLIDYMHHFLTILFIFIFRTLSTIVVGIKPRYLKTPWATPCLVVNDFMYNCHSNRGNRGYWRYNTRQLILISNQILNKISIHSQMSQLLKEEGRREMSSSLCVGQWHCKISNWWTSQSSAAYR